MGVVIPFPEIRPAGVLASAQPMPAAGHLEQPVIDAIDGWANQTALLVAAGPLLDLCRDRYGFVLMCDGLPDDAAAIGRALLELYRGLVSLDAAMKPPRIYPRFGVYLGRRQLAWFEDGYSGETGLAMPNDTLAVDLAAFVQPRVVCSNRSRQ